MRILFVAPIHHPEALREAHAAARLQGAPPPLFPPSVSQHFYEKALIKRGHTLAVFYRNQSGFAPQDAVLRGQTKAHRQGITPGKLIEAGLNRVPPRVNPDLRIRNQRLIDQARTFKPDVLWMVGDNTVIYPETIAAIKRESGCKALYAVSYTHLTIGAHSVSLFDRIASTR